MTDQKQSFGLSGGFTRLEMRSLPAALSAALASDGRKLLYFSVVSPTAFPATDSDAISSVKTNLFNVESLALGRLAFQGVGLLRSSSCCLSPELNYRRTHASDSDAVSLVIVYICFRLVHYTEELILPS